MTVQMRSRRRLLPKKSIIDIDYISPTAGIQELMYTATPSQKDHQIINELLGKENKEQPSQIVLGKPKRRSSQKETRWSDFFEQHSIIPGQKLEVIHTTQETTKSVRLIHSNNSSSDIGDLLKDINIGQKEQVNFLESNIQEVMIQTNEEQGEHTTGALESIENENIGQDLTEHNESLDSTVHRHTTNTKRTHTKNKDQTVSETAGSFNEEDTNSMEPVVVIVETAKKKKKREVNESFMLQPSKVPKKPRSHDTIQALKFSGALDWRTDGKDDDPRKQDIGIVRRRQLERRLQQPIEPKRVPHPKPKFIVQ